jgi:hypothetical protein
VLETACVLSEAACAVLETASFTVPTVEPTTSPSGGPVALVAESAVPVTVLVTSPTVEVAVATVVASGSDCPARLGIPASATFAYAAVTTRAADMQASSRRTRWCQWRCCISPVESMPFTSSRETGTAFRGREGLTERASSPGSVSLLPLVVARQGRREPNTGRIGATEDAVPAAIQRCPGGTASVSSNPPESTAARRGWYD